MLLPARHECQRNEGLDNEELTRVSYAGKDYEAILCLISISLRFGELDREVLFVRLWRLGSKT